MQHHRDVGPRRCADHAHNRNSQYPTENNIHDLCDVLASPDQFNGKLVSIRGTYRTAFEASELYSLCSPVGVWVDFDGGEKAWKRVDKMMVAGTAP